VLVGNHQMRQSEDAVWPCGVVGWSCRVSDARIAQRHSTTVTHTTSVFSSIFRLFTPFVLDIFTSFLLSFFLSSFNTFSHHSHTRRTRIAFPSHPLIPTRRLSFLLMANSSHAT
jgi:hypothetical protein